jgi:DNA-binding transcriptional regulator LsrR (DeoR family)
MHMQHIYSDEQLRLAARLYYVDGLGQNEVAKFVKVSQAKISRLLSMARERGIVRITVADYEPRHRHLEKQLREEIGFSTVIIIKAIEGLSTLDLRRAVGYFAAPAVDALIQPKDIVALAGGRTIYELVRHLPEHQSKALTVVQAMGSVDSNANVFDAQEVGRVMAQRLGGTFLALNSPAYFPEKQTRNALLKLGQVRNVHEHWSRANVAIVGVGTLQNSLFVERGVLQVGGINELARAGAVGEICGRFIEAGGNECATAWKDRVMSIEGEQLRKIPQVIGIVSGSDRSAAVLAAVRGRILKSLVIDETGAAALLDAARATNTRKPKTKKGKK